MSTMKFANVLFEQNPRSLKYPAMYCEANQPVDYDAETRVGGLCDKGSYDFTTYFNSLSVAKLKKYTIAKGFVLHLELKGASCRVTQTMGDAFSAHPQTVENTACLLNASEDWQAIDMPLIVTDEMIIVGFMIETEGRVSIRNSYYAVEYDGDLRDVELALATTTFKKESFIEHNIGLVKDEILGSDEDIAKHFSMYVIDNGRTLDFRGLSDEHVHVRPNDNVGGAGGFARGMIEAMEQTPQATHILLMDDDVDVSPESIKRTYNLLRLVNDEYTEAFVSGAMLNYEVGEDQWEDVGYMTPEGTFSPTKPPLRLTKFEDLIYNEIFQPAKRMREQCYAAWWYCCIPIATIKREGLPLPVFVRCDDAEYGIRCHPKFISMNGLCIWHMSFHARYNAAVERYQTTRNTMIAQATTGMAPQSDFMYELHNNIRLELKKFGYANAELCLDAFEDFLKGPEFIKQMGVAESCFMRANKVKERLVPFSELQKQADVNPELEGFDLKKIDRQLIDGDKPRTYAERFSDFITDNGQRYFKTEGKGYAVIPVLGWTYPAGVIRNKKYLIVIDWYNRTGAIRIKDSERFAEIMKRYQRDLRYYKKNIKRLRAEYTAARPELTSIGFWKQYLKMN